MPMRHPSRLGSSPRRWRRPIATLFACGLLAAGMAIATPAAANQSVTVQAQQTDWYVNDDPVLFGPSEYWYSGQVGQGYGSNNFKFTYAFRSDTADNWAHWYMGRRIGRQQVSVYVPHADATATVVYEVTADNGLFTLAQLNQANTSGWTTLGTWDFNGGDVVIVAADNDASPVGSKIGVDAIAMRCVSNCGAQPDVPAVPSAVQYNSGALFWNAARGATSYDVIVWSDSGSTIIHGVECCAYLFLSKVLRTAERISVRSVNGAGRSEWAPTVSVRRRVEAPAVPSGLRFSSGVASWNSVSGATSYNVGLCVFDGNVNGCVVEVDVACCSWRISDTSVTHVRVQAVNSAGGSAWSSDVQSHATHRQSLRRRRVCGSVPEWHLGIRCRERHRTMWDCVSLRGT